MSEIIIPALVVLAILIVVFLILREINMWYWKINERIALQNRTNFLLENILMSLKSPNSNTVNSNNNELASPATSELKQKSKLVQHETDKGIVEIAPCIKLKGENAFIDGKPAPDGVYKFGFMWNVHIKDGIVIKG